MTTIIGFSGKKISGKTTSCNFIVGHSMHSLGIVRHGFKITKEGQLHITDLFGDTAYEGIFDVFRNTKAVKDFLAQHLNDYVKVYSLADILKTEVCHKILGIPYECMYGSDADKNRETHLRWEDMPGVINDSDFWFSHQEALQNQGMVYHTPGNMTGREVMQFVGTEIFRKMYGDVWVDALIRRIQEDSPALALICDVRFPNEVFGIQRNGGIVIRLTKNQNSSDRHESEIALDPDRFDWNNFNAVIDNDKMTIEETNAEVYSLLYNLGLVKGE